MEPEDSLPHSQQPAPCSNSEPHKSSPCSPSHSLKIYFNIILLSMPWSSKWSLSLIFQQPKPCTNLSSPPPSPLMYATVCYSELCFFATNFTATIKETFHRFLTSRGGKCRAMFVVQYDRTYWPSSGSKFVIC